MSYGRNGSACKCMWGVSILTVWHSSVNVRQLDVGVAGFEPATTSTPFTPPRKSGDRLPPFSYEL